jgi:hypothetical protein
MKRSEGSLNDRKRSGTVRNGERSGMARNCQERPGTLRNGERSGTVDGQERLGTFESERINALERIVENGHGTVTHTHQKRKKHCIKVDRLALYRYFYRYFYHKQKKVYLSFDCFVCLYFQSKLIK